jgi:predicted small secreted protein
MRIATLGTLLLASASLAACATAEIGETIRPAGAGCGGR